MVLMEDSADLAMNESGKRRTGFGLSGVNEMNCVVNLAYTQSA